MINNCRATTKEESLALPSTSRPRLGHPSPLRQTFNRISYFSCVLGICVLNKDLSCQSYLGYLLYQRRKFFNKKKNLDISQIG